MWSYFGQATNERARGGRGWAGGGGPIEGMQKRGKAQFPKASGWGQTEGGGRKVDSNENTYDIPSFPGKCDPKDGRNSTSLPALHPDAEASSSFHHGLP